MLKTEQRLEKRGMGNEYRAWRQLLDRLPPFTFDYYLTVSYRYRQTHDEVQNLNRKLKRWMCRDFSNCRILSESSMNFLFFIERHDKSDACHTHCLFSLPLNYFSSTPYANDNSQKREDYVRADTNGALKRLKSPSGGYLVGSQWRLKKIHSLNRLYDYHLKQLDFTDCVDVMNSDLT